MNFSKITSLVLFLFFLGFSAQAQTETRTPGKFTGVSSEGSWDVIITIGDIDQVKLVSKGFDLSEVITEVDNGNLEIELKDDDDDNRDFTVYVTIKKLETLGLAGSGNIMVRSDVYADEFSIGQAGSGNVELEMLQTKSLNVGMSGTGDVVISKGKASDVNIGQVGSGDFKGIDLLCGDIKIGKAGSGDIHVGVEGELTVGSVGSGNVYYSGTPTDITKGNLGSTKVIKR
ncbi:head GIN domain-containing protein [Algoriphagus yeomjeoni]|uniref:Putative autotransporter adhesin-like protein n=1 Tax=Algoriphagus yeomjeoni TaxID=291403 RepID=A0A327P856_9BACT|nr:head GIN domain-containing protein [Algoriphagus yeomjeoni]RAI88408.1 putative autotransporter adhesin-like protein [Algoriphagus yeomjeoni]